MPSDKRERVRTLLGEKKFSEMDAAERALIADAAMAWVHGDAAVSHEPRSLSEFVRADEATRERIGAEVAAGAIERQQSSTQRTLDADETAQLLEDLRAGVSDDPTMAQCRTANDAMKLAAEILSARLSASAATIPASYIEDAKLILKAKGWKEPEGYSDSDTIKRLLLDNAAEMALNPKGWDAKISEQIRPELERIARETRQAAHADMTIRTPDGTTKP